MLSPSRDLDLGATGSELDDDRFVTQPLQAAGVRGILPAQTIDRYQFIADHERCLGPDALAEFGDLTMVTGEFTRQAPGRRAARLLLATGPVAGSCWGAPLISGRAWTWPVPPTARLVFGAVLLLAVLALLVAATSQHSCQRTRLAMLASPVILSLDVTAVAAVMLAAPALTWTLGAAMAVSLGRIAFTARTLPRLATR